MFIEISYKENMVTALNINLQYNFLINIVFNVHDFIRRKRKWI